MGVSGARLRAQRTARTVASATQSGARAGASAARGTSRLVHRITGASGAGRTGLSNLIELTAASSAGDAFVAVALAGTLFFNASVNQARSQVALALVVTMAPFAVLAPLIGPLLDRVQQGRRYILAGTLLARGLLCWGMAGAVLHHDEVTLLPAAFGVLVLQKAFGVTRSSIAPRLLPRQITLVAANARAGLAALVASTLGVALAGGVDVIAGGGTGGAAWVLRVGTVVYLAAMALSFTVPERVDVPLPRQPGPPGPGRPHPGAQAPTVPLAAPGQAGGSRGANRGRWRTLRLVGPVVGEAMRANAALRAFSGFMVFFLAFLLRTVHFPGTSDKAALAGMIIAAGAGGFLGSLLGAGLRARRHYLMLFGMLALAMAVTIVCAVFFGLWAALVVALMAAFGQVLGKLALDSTVQDEIGEEIRSSAFAASETVHQLSWVAGGLAGLALSLTKSGVAGLSVAAAGLFAALVVLLAQRRHRVVTSQQAQQRHPVAP
ncbi:MAG: MFS transporter [Nocardiopsaceae bacterium]|jgi:MFS family permease|nr:MFS transporter [Nocardiopsaceae bacterium]